MARAGHTVQGGPRAGASELGAARRVAFGRPCLMGQPGSRQGSAGQSVLGNAALEQAPPGKGVLEQAPPVRVAPEQAPSVKAVLGSHGTTMEICQHRHVQP